MDIFLFFTNMNIYLPMLDLLLILEKRLSKLNLRMLTQSWPAVRNINGHLGVPLDGQWGDRSPLHREAGHGPGSGGSRRRWEDGGGYPQGGDHCDRRPRSRHALTGDLHWQQLYIADKAAWFSWFICKFVLKSVNCKWLISNLAILNEVLITLQSEDVASDP